MSHAQTKKSETRQTGDRPHFGHSACEDREEARRLQWPLPDGVRTIVAVGAKEDPEDERANGALI